MNPIEVLMMTNHDPHEPGSSTYKEGKFMTLMTTFINLYMKAEVQNKRGANLFIERRRIKRCKFIYEKKENKRDDTDLFMEINKNTKPFIHR